MLLANMERHGINFLMIKVFGFQHLTFDFFSPSAEFPYIVYYTINTTQTDPFAFFTAVKSSSLSKFDPKTTRYSAAHTLDIYSEVASICRPPLQLAPNDQMNMKKTPTTAYIISVYKVFEGDDGERFERNWLYWTGKLLNLHNLINSREFSIQYSIKFSCQVPVAFTGICRKVLD